MPNSNRRLIAFELGRPWWHTMPHRAAFLLVASQLARVRQQATFIRLNLEVRHDMPERLQVALTVCSIAAGLLLSGLILVALGVEPRELLRTFIFENLTIFGNLRSVLAETARLIIVGLAAAVAFKARFWNLGLEGQMIWGGIGAAFVSIYQVGAPGGRIFLMLVAALGCAALWGLLAFLLKRRFGANEIIVTLLLNYVAINFLFHLLFGPWADPVDAFPHSKRFESFERLPRLSGGIGLELPIVIVTMAAMWWLTARSRWGFYMRFVDANARMAAATGLPIQSLAASAVALSASLAGFAGFLICAGEQGRLTQGFFQNYGVSGVLIAFLARNNPLVIGAVSFLMAMLYDTGRSLQVFNQIPFSFVQLAQAVIVMVVASSEFFIRHRLRIVRRDRDVVRGE
ncbi:MAG: ABC transporter permease [Hyphomicrobiaceae bacterium]|nr:ABC transporter permease [Hyphomicrobiaceae bacterium]